MKNIFLFSTSIFISIHSLSAAISCPNLSGKYKGIDIKSQEYTSEVTQTKCEQVTIDDSRYDAAFIYTTNGELHPNPQPSPSLKYVRPYFVSNLLVVETFDSNKNKVLTVLHSISDKGDLVASVIMENDANDPAQTFVQTSSKE